METPADSSRRRRGVGAKVAAGQAAATRGIGARDAAARGVGARGVGARGAAGNSRAMVLGSLTIPGRPEQGSLARAFVARTPGTNQTGAGADGGPFLKAG